MGRTGNPIEQSMGLVGKVSGFPRRLTKTPWISHPLGNTHLRDLHREIKIAASPIGGTPAHTPKPDAHSILHLRGNLDHNRLPPVRNGDDFAGSRKGLPRGNDNGPMRVQFSLHLGTDMLKPRCTSSLQGMGKPLVDPGSRKGQEEPYGSQTEDESPYVSPPGNSGRLSTAHRGEKELD